MPARTSAELVADPILAYPAATVAAFDPTEGDLPRRRLDKPRTKQFLERLDRLDVPGVLIAASTGQGHLRTVEELQEWLRCAASTDLQQMTLMALLRPEDGLDNNRILLDLLIAEGYSVVFFRPGNNLYGDDAGVVAQLTPLIREAADRDLAIGLYSIPDVSNVRLTAEAAAELLRVPGGDLIVAAKITEADYEQSTLAYLQHPELKRLKIVQGWDPFLTRALQDGPQHDPENRQRCGITSGPMSLAVHQYLHILDRATAGDFQEVVAAQQAVTAVFQSMQDDPLKFADLQRAKWMMGLGHPLTDTVTQGQADRVLQALQQLPRPEDRQRMAASLDLLQDGPFHEQLVALQDC